MKKITFLLGLIMMAWMGYSQTTDLIISEYIEGSSNNKALEIYNGTGATVDLSGYQIWKIVNGGNWSEYTMEMTGSLSDGDVYVIYNSSADPAIVAVGDTAWNSASWNGDDAVGLAKDDGTGTFQLIDAVGEDGDDPGAGWDVAGVGNATKNHTLVRKETVCSPNTNWATSAGTDATNSEWVVYDQDTFTYIGSHTSNCGSSNIFIVGSFQSTPWTPGDPDYEMTLNANGVYVLTKNLPAADNEYKVIEGIDWTAPTYPANNQHIILSDATDTTWRVNADDDLVMHTLPVVAGDFFDAMGSGANWDPTNLAGEMTDTDGDDVYTLDLVVPAGSWQCKVTLNNNWDQSTGGNITFTADGINATTFTYDFSTNTTTITGPPPPTALVTFIVYDTAGQNYDGFNLKGSWDDNGNYDPSWDGGNEHSAFYDDGTNGDSIAGDHIWTCQQELIVDDGANTWEWGVDDSEHNWIAGNWQFTVPNSDPQTLSWEVPSTPALVINEIMYNSPGADEEWVELYHNTSAPINLENWKLVDNDASHTPIIIPAGYSIDAGGYFTIQISDNGDFPFTPDYDGSGNFGLGNGGDAVRIWDADGILVDIVVYDDSSPWPTAPDGDGPTLSLIDPNYDNSLPGSWLASEQDGGTPGAINFLPQSFITVLEPNGGESIQQGSVYTIKWSYGNWDGNIEIDLFHGDNDSSMIVNNLPASDSSFDWIVSDNQDIDTNYKIKIKGVNTGDPSDMSDNSFSIIESYSSPQLVITEIMYNPPESGDDSLEFIELYNNGADAASLNGLHFSEGVEFTFPDMVLPPNDYIVVAKNSMAMLNTFGINALQWTSGGLSNGGEDIVLLDLVDQIVDSLSYDDQAPWPTAPDGDGSSLTLCNPDFDNSLGENWNASVNFAAVNADGDSIFATPGYACQIQLMASFDVDTTLVQLGDSIHFTDNSTGNPTSWEWIFEGGTPATYSGQNPPAITYNTAGYFDVTLIVSNGPLTDTLYVHNLINAGVAPVADFEATETTVLVGGYTNFTNLSTGEGVNYYWIFEGATPETSIEVDPQEIYYLIPADSLYDVTLVAFNVYGSDTLTKVDYIHTIPEGVTENTLSSSVQIYPNPSNGLVYLTLPENTKVSVSVSNLLGSTVYSANLSGSNKIYLNDLTKGIYLIKIVNTANGESVTKRLILK